MGEFPLVPDRESLLVPEEDRATVQAIKSKSMELVEYILEQQRDGKPSRSALGHAASLFKEAARIELAFREHDLRVARFLWEVEQGRKDPLGDMDPRELLRKVAEVMGRVPTGEVVEGDATGS